ncbi:NAD(P)/FAD-dependent oxidoreductase [Streptomyces sp. BH106]|uniref:NAD(P)/FAD-dependent oxidoreductase n=1 Tax=Streptomyces sp. BH106 TaxID=3410409 RepID=UPI003CF41991
MSESYDVIVNGASIAGCTAAVLYARQGARVALLERRSDMSAYKVLCTHYIQACGHATLAELGVTRELEDAGAVPNSARYWTRWGWIRPEDDPHERSLPFGYNVRRQTLDPILRRLALDTDGVDLLLGHTLDRVLAEGGRVVGVSTTSGGARRDLRGRLVVGADGKDSTVGRLVGATAKRVDNQRFSYFAHFKGLPRPKGDVTLSWFREPDVGYAMPNDGDITLVACIPSKSSLPRFREDLEGSFRAFVKSLPGAPDLDRGELVGKIVGTVNYPLISRRPTGPGWALIGDAALTSDPLWGVGCGWALQSAQWLVDETSAAVRAAGDLDRSLAAYRGRRSKLKGYQFLISDFASGRPFNPVEKLMFSAAARDPGMARHFHTFGSRLIGTGSFLSPSSLTKATLVNLRHRLRPATAVPAGGV